MRYMRCLKQVYHYHSIWIFGCIHIHLLRGISECRDIGVYVCMYVAAFMIAKRYTQDVSLSILRLNGIVPLRLEMS